MKILLSIILNFTNFNIYKDFSILLGVCYKAYRLILITIEKSRFPKANFNILIFLSAFCTRVYLRDDLPLQ